MFRPRRSLSTRRLWRQRCGKLRGQREDSASEEPHHGLCPAALQLFKKLRDEQLWRLAEAVESKGRWECGCIWYPLEARLCKTTLPPQALLCKLYRWPDLSSASELKRLSQCQDFQRSSALCCNPYHYSRLLPPDPTTPLPYKARDKPRPLQPITNQESSFYNTLSVYDGAQTLGSQQGEWCKLAYWEHRTRVGRLFGVSSASLHIFQDAPQGSGLCLGLLSGGSGSLAVRRTRRKIGQGLLLSREQGEVWIYNRSDHPLFISSPSLPRSSPVCRLPPGYCTKVYDPESRAWGPAATEGPCDPHSLRISFAKGWGARYSRQFITSCPCWLEVLLRPPATVTMET